MFVCLFFFVFQISCKPPFFNFHNRPFSFELVTTHRIYSVAAESAAEMQSWLEAVADGVPDDQAPKGPKKNMTAEDLVTKSSSSFLIWSQILTQ